MLNIAPLQRFFELSRIFTTKFRPALSHGHRIIGKIVPLRAALGAALSVGRGFPREESLRLWP